MYLLLLFLSLSYHTIPYKRAAFVFFLFFFYKYPCSLFIVCTYIYLHINNLQNIHMYIHDPVDFTFLNILILFTNTVFVCNLQVQYNSGRSRFTLCISPLELIYISTDLQLIKINCANLKPRSLEFVRNPCTSLLKVSSFLYSLRSLQAYLHMCLCLHTTKTDR